MLCVSTPNPTHEDIFVEQTQYSTFLLPFFYLFANIDTEAVVAAAALARVFDPLSSSLDADFLCNVRSNFLSFHIVRVQRRPPTPLPCLLHPRGFFRLGRIVVKFHRHHVTELVLLL